MEKNLKEGQIFACKISGLSRLVFDEKNIFSLKDIKQKQIDNKISKNTYLLFQYIGDNLCEEYYTGKIFQIDYFKNFRIIHEEDFVKKFSRDLDYPLVICLEEEKMLQFDIEDNEFKNEFSKNTRREDILTEIINSNYYETKENLKKHMNRIIDRDYSDAYLENAIYNFQKRKVKSK